MAAKVVVVTSGKGGVGKTTTTAALGAALAQGGQKVALIDFDVGLRNLDLVMGAERRREREEAEAPEASSVVPEAPDPPSPPNPGLHDPGALPRFIVAAESVFGTTVAFGLAPVCAAAEVVASTLLKMPESALAIGFPAAVPMVAPAAAAACSLRAWA